jgi:spoIIIJ-associated protein
VGAKKAKIRVVTSKKEKGGLKTQPVKGNANKKQKAQKKTPENPPVKETLKAPENPAIKPAAVEEKAEEVPVETIELGKSIIQKIIDKITDEASVQIENKGEEVVYHVEGGKAALIIGKRGQTLEAIQYIVDRAINKNRERRIRFQIDVAGYLENKRANLEQRAMHLAEKVKKTGKPVTVGELNVYDRKIVHLCLKEDNYVRTQSMGSGFYRKLVIFPKKAGASKKTNS